MLTLLRTSEWLRTQAARNVLVAMFGLFATPTYSADYKIDYAIKSEVGEDVGVIESCEFNRLCTFESKSLGYLLSAEIFSLNPRTAYVNMREGADCCFFSGATAGLSLKVTTKFAAIPFFAGQRAKGSEYVQNKNVGILYLHFSFLKN